MKLDLFRKNSHKLIFLSLVTAPLLSSAETLSIQVKETYLRDKPSFLSKQKAKLSYAQQVNSQKKKNSWNYVKVTNGRSQGWVHNSALSDQVIVLESSKKISKTSVSQNEILMAGKGFNKSVENKYKKENKNLNYKAVDAIERTKKIDTNTLIRFAKNGKLSL